MNTQGKAALTLGVALLMILIAWRASLPEPRGWRAAIVLDRSSSFASSCSSLVSLVEEVVVSAKGAPLHLTVLVTGDRSTAFEPARFDLPSLPSATEDVLFGSRNRKLALSRFLDSVAARCDLLQPANVSPLYLAIHRALELVNADTAAGRRSVTVASDLEETAMTDIRNALGGFGGSGRAGPPRGRLANGRTDVRLCGVSSTRGFIDAGDGRRQLATRPRGATQADRIRDVWMQLFVDSSRIAMEPYCMH